MKELMFQDASIKLIERDGKHWVSAVEIADALGYSRADSVTRIYDKHKAEFSKSMTVVVENTDSVVSGNLVSRARMFSLRGAHLIGMFARTAKAQEFRRWVLDVLESHEVGRSTIQQAYEALAALKAQDKFASMCGKGLSDHKRIKPPLVEKANALMDKLQPSLALD